ncbi:MAG: TIGR01458 family HAD-type hydrolase [Gammaproteobacteria bacterium]
MKGVLIDLDGVIWENDKVVLGAAETIAWLKEKAIPYLFVTNTTSKPRRLIAEKLIRLGIDVDVDELLTPPIAAALWLTQHAPGPAALLVPDATLEDFANIPNAELDHTGGLAAVVIGDIGEAWTYKILNDAFRQLMVSDPPQLVALGMTRYWRASDGLRLDVAPFIKALEYAACCQAVVLGKPSAAFFDIALQQIGCVPIDTIMIGDDVLVDVLGAQEAGMQGFLTRTGKFRPHDLDAGIMPDALLNSIADLPKWLSADNQTP